MAINYDPPSFDERTAGQKPRARVFEKRDEHRERDRLQRALTAELLARDQSRCRCCGRRGKYEATVAADALHRHHLVYRSRGGLDTLGNILTLCALCHALIHARQLWPLGKDANARVTFEIAEAAVVEIFGTKPVPPHVRIVTERRG